jgi:chemotaxis protein CheX
MAALAILSDHYDISMRPRGEAQTIRGTGALDAVTVLLGITGDIEGQFLLGCDAKTALNIARVMMDKPEYPELDGLCQSALAELGNMIGGRTSTNLAEMGLLCNLTPPSVLSSTNGMVSLGIPVMITWLFSTPAGELRFCVGLRGDDDLEQKEDDA